MEKTSFRREIRKNIEEFEEAYIIESDNLIFHKLISTLELLSADTVFAYFSIGREVDTRKLISFCLAMDKKLALPLVSGRNLEFALIENLIDLVSGTYGIPSPPPEAKRVKPLSNDAVIVPALCYDERLYRLGRGGGYYDRFLADSPAVSIGLCREKLICQQVPIEYYDVPVSILITEKRKRGP